MQIEARRAKVEEVLPLRELYRYELHGQIRYDSMLRRGLADPYLLLVDGRVAAYGAILNRYDAGRLTEFHTLPYLRAAALPLFRALLSAGRPTAIAAQTNDPLLLGLLHDCAREIRTESILFADAGPTGWPCPEGGVFRRGGAADRAPDAGDPDPQWVIEAAGAVVAAGGFLTHYNPPFADIFMSVAPTARRRGFGSYLVQEIKRVCYEAGHRPAARCNPDNTASRRTLEKAGLLPCGRVLVGEVPPDPA